MFRVDTFWTQKYGNRSAEYEDASENRVDESRVLAAISDGASEAMLAGRWARHLTREVVHGRATDAAARIKTAHRTWPRVVSTYVRGRERSGRPIAWYEEPGLARGAAATLTVFAATSATRKSWRAFAVGDSCLFHVRGTSLRRAFPIQASSAFSMTPDLIYSRTANGQALGHALEHRVRGSWRTGDRFYLATDALSAWLLERQELGEPAWIELDHVDQREFANWVDAARVQGMHNDDVTLLRIEAE